MTTVQESLSAVDFDAVTRRLEPPSKIRRWHEPGVVRVAGEIDDWTVDEFQRALTDCDADPCVHALDLTGVEFFAAVGVSCFVERGWTVRPHAGIIASPAVRRVLTVCDMEFLLGLHGWQEAYDGWRVRRYPSF